MKKIFILISSALFSLTLSAQYLNVTDVYFVDDPSASASSDTGLTTGSQMILKFDFRNNLSGGQALNPGDSVTFGWSALGVRIGTLGTRSWPSPMANGLSAKLYSHEHIPLPRDSCFSWEVCVWPLFNPYAPNTDSLKGRHCTTFRTNGCKGAQPTFIELKKDDNSSNFYVVNHILHFEFPIGSDNNNLELFNLAGVKVMSEQVSTQGTVDVSSNIKSGVYILKASNQESEVIQKVFIK